MVVREKRICKTKAGQKARVTPPILELKKSWCNKMQVKMPMTYAENHMREIGFFRRIVVV